MAPRLSFLLFAVATADAIVPCASNMQVSVRFTNDIYCVYTPPCSGLHLPEKTGCPTKGAVAIHSTNILQTDTCCAIIDSKNAVGCVIPVPGSTQCIVGPTTVPSAPATTTYESATPSTWISTIVPVSTSASSPVTTRVTAPSSTSSSIFPAANTPSSPSTAIVSSTSTLKPTNASDSSGASSHSITEPPSNKGTPKPSTSPSMTLRVVVSIVAVAVILATI